jgi:lipopolysaccharide transport system ATP-binding protein
MSKVIEINNLSKVYDLGLVGTGTLSRDLNRTWAKLRGQPDPYATIVELNDRTQKSSSNMVYALKDINFSVEQGDVLGIIGKNGAGKSTLLKILSQITSPSSGTIKMKGHVASLLEVGTGMHPEMTARQNIYLNGSLMGMRRHEITSKLDEIVDFAGIEKYIDTPTKRFSSGMTVRLGFAIAAFLEPEILIVDEVLAVGDYEFQKKAIGKMQDVSKGEGRTVLFVSHNMHSVKQLCTKGLILNQGQLVFHHNVRETINYYQNEHVETNLVQTFNKEKIIGNTEIQLKKLEISPLDGDLLNVDSGFEIKLDVLLLQNDNDYDITYRLKTEDDIFVFTHGYFFKRKESDTGLHEITVTVPSNFLNAGKFKLDLIIGENQKFLIKHVEDIILFEIENTMTGRGNNTKIPPGVTRPILKTKCKMKDNEK